MPIHYFIVRSTVPDASKRAAFDTWYSREHMPDAVKSFDAEKAWRLWSVTDPAVHEATYQFADRATLDRAMASDDMKRLVAVFDHDWPSVKRTREIFALVEKLDGKP